MYVCVGLVAVLVPPSPNVQLKDVAFWLEFVIMTDKPAVWMVNPAVGTVLTVMVAVAVLLPAELVAVIVTKYTPGVFQVETGFCSVEVAGVPPSKIQEKLVELLLEVLLNNTVKGAQPIALLKVNAATGIVTMVTVCSIKVVPQLFVAANVTV